MILLLLFGLHQIIVIGMLYPDTLSLSLSLFVTLSSLNRCGNVAAIMELDKDLNSSFKIFNAAPDEIRGVPEKKPPPEYFL